MSLSLSSLRRLGNGCEAEDQAVDDTGTQIPSLKRLPLPSLPPHSVANNILLEGIKTFSSVVVGYVIVAARFHLPNRVSVCIYTIAAP
jgi:hypothetical protein